MFNLKHRLSIYYIALFLLSAISVPSFSQENDAEKPKNNAEIKLIRADSWFYSRNKNVDAQYIVGDVVLSHDSAVMYCDSALLYKSTNTLEAFGNVHIVENDTLNLYGKYLKYNGNTKIANIKNNVKLVDPTTTLTTDELFFDRNTQTAFYSTGATTTNGDNTLTSMIGYYHTNTNDFVFHQDVVITSPDYLLKSDTMLYNTDSEIVTAIDSTTIYNQTNTMFCKKGTYNLNLKKGHFYKNVEIHYDNYILFSDSLYYDDNIQYAEATGNVVTIDTTNKLTSWSNYLEYSKIGEYAFISDSAKTRMINSNDTSFILADTIYAKFDSTLNHIKTYHHTKLIHRDFQAVCDSAVFYKTDSCAILYKLPALWSSSNQITGDSIIIYSNDSTISKIVVPTSGFIVSQDTLGSFNQIKGTEIIIIFSDNKINHVDIDGNSKTIYYLREDDGKMIGPNIVSSINSKIIFKDGNMQQFVFYKDIKSDLFPIEKFDKTQEKLDGFQWRIEEKPDFDKEN